MSTLVLPRTEYDPFACLYDRHMGADFARRAFPIIERLLLARPAPGARVLDLCCGSGRVTALLSDRGYQVLGVDASEPMLRLAQRNAPRSQFVLADARDIVLPPVFAAAVSTFNSLAHLRTVDDLVHACARVRAALVPGSAWLFDLTMEEAYAARWRGSYAMVETQDCCIVRPSYNPETKLAQNEITMFHVEQSGRWARSDFTIFQRCHSEPEVCAALAAAGFAAVESFDAERDLGLQGGRGCRFFLAC